MLSDALVVGPVWASLALYVLALARRSRLAWTVGYALFLLHVAAAFHFVHGWSHAAAYESTARRTAELTGVASGFGLWLNYLFAVVWGVDVVWWWRDAAGYRGRPLWVGLAVQGFVAFMWFNAAVVFARWRV